MNRLKKPKDFLEKLGLTDSDYQDSGMINHIADLLERYHKEQLALTDVVKPFYCNNKEKGIEHSLCDVYQCLNCKEFGQ
jgi:hypothetical protein